MTLDVIVKFGSAAVPELLAIVREKEPELAFNAILALGRIGAPEAVPELVSGVNELLSPTLRACVIESLGLIADKRAIATLIAALKDPHSAVRANAAAAVLRIPDSSFLRPLMNALADDDAEVRRFAVIGLGELGDRKALPQLTLLLQRWRDLIDVDAALLVATIEAVGKVGDTNATAVLLPLLEATDETVLMKVLAALRRLKAPETGSALTRMLSDPRPTIRRLTIDILGRSGDAAALEPLSEILRREPSHELRAIAARSLGELKLSAATPVLEEALRDEMVVRLQAVIALGRIKHKRSLPGLMAMLRDSAPEIRYQALLAIGRFGDPKAVRAVSVLLMDDDPMVKQGAIAALEQLGQHGAADAEKLIRKVRWRDRALGIVPQAVWILIPSRKVAGAIAALALVLVSGFFLRSTTGQQPRAAVNRGGVSELSFSADGTRLAVGRSRGLSELWSIPDKKMLANAVGGRSPTYTADAQSALIVMNQQLVKWSLDSEEKPDSEKPLDPAKLKRWCVTPDAKWGAAVSTNGEVAIWDLSQLRKSQELNLGLENSVAVAISPDGSLVAGSNSVGTVTLFETGSGKSILRLQAPTNEPLSLLAISSDHRWVAASAGSKGGALVWQLDESGGRVQSARRLVAHGPFATVGLAFFPDDDRLLVAALNGVNVFSLKTEDVLSVPHSLSKVDSVALDAAGKHLAIGSSDDSQIVLVDAATGTVIAELDTQ
jgi:HEAT repeat protein